MKKEFQEEIKAVFEQLKSKEAIMYVPSQATVKSITYRDTMSPKAGYYVVSLNGHSPAIKLDGCEFSDFVVCSPVAPPVLPKVKEVWINPNTLPKTFYLILHFNESLREFLIVDSEREIYSASFDFFKTKKLIPTDMTEQDFYESYL